MRNRDGHSGSDNANESICACVHVNEYEERIPMEKQVHCFVSALLYVEVTREYN